MGLDKIISTQEQVGGLQEQLTAMEPVLIKTQAEVEGMIVTIIQDKEEAGKTQKTVRKVVCVFHTSIIPPPSEYNESRRHLSCIDESVTCRLDVA